MATSRKKEDTDGKDLDTVSKPRRETPQQKAERRERERCIRSAARGFYSVSVYRVLDMRGLLPSDAEASELAERALETANVFETIADNHKYF